VWNPSRDEWLPSYRVIHLDCVVIEQKPAPTIIPISEGVLAAFHAPKGGNREPGEDEQSDCCSIEWREDIGRRSLITMGRSAETSGWSRSTPLANHLHMLPRSAAESKSLSAMCSIQRRQFSSRRMPIVPWISRSGAQRPWLSRCVRCLIPPPTFPGVSPCRRDGHGT
jgi:hypothetical protein